MRIRPPRHVTSRPWSDLRFKHPNSIFLSSNPRARSVPVVLSAAAAPATTAPTASPVGILHDDVFESSYVSPGGPGGPCGPLAPRRPTGRAICLYSPAPPHPPSEYGPTLLRRPTSVMLNWIEVPYAPTADVTGSCLLLRGERKSYYFGRMSESTQRAMSERSVSLVSYGTIFLTGPVGCDAMGGLLGYVLSMTDSIAGQKLAAMEIHAKKKQRHNWVPPKRNIFQNIIDRIEVHGGHNLNYYLASSRHFIFRYGVPIRTVEQTDDPRMAAAAASAAASVAASAAASASVATAASASAATADPVVAARPDFEDDCIKVWKVPVRSGSQSYQPPPGPASRKRSHDRAMADESEPSAADKEEQALVDKQVIETVVRHMFNSDWSRDLLVEYPISMVDHGGSIFIRHDDGPLRQYNGPWPGDEDYDPKRMVWAREPWPASKVTNLPPAKSLLTSMCYVVQHQPRRGKFDPKAAEALNIPKMEYKTLCSGKSVEVDGRTIEPDQVLSEPFRGHGFAFIDLPDASYVPAFLARPEWSSDAIMDTIKLMHWHLGPGLVDLAEIRQFMRERGHVEHRVASAETCPNMVTFLSAARAMAHYGVIDRDRYPPLHFSNMTQLPAEGVPYRPLQTGQKIRVMPQWVIDDQDVAPSPGLSNALAGVPGRVRNVAAKAAALVRTQAFRDEVEELERDMPNRDAEITTLGTGSSAPSKHRNVACTLVRVPGYGNYLLDCGESSLHQMRRAYGVDETVAIMADLRVIVISHNHADHHLGSVSVIRAWARAAAADSRLTIICSSSLRRFFQEYSRIEDISLARLRFITDLPPTDMARVQGKWYGPGDPSGLESVKVVNVDHCRYARGTVLEWRTGLRIAYSGDCRPSKALVEAARGCTLLIHEATLDDSLQEDAVAKKHCTMSEALQVAQSMDARRVLLTHFSQRFAKYPNMEDGVLGVGSKPSQAAAAAAKAGPEAGPGSAESKGGDKQIVLMAFDMMRVKLGEFRHAQAFVPAFRRYFEIMMSIDPSGDADVTSDKEVEGGGD